MEPTAPHRPADVSRQRHCCAFCCVAAVRVVHTVVHTANGDLSVCCTHPLLDSLAPAAGLTSIAPTMINDNLAATPAQQFRSVLFDLTGAAMVVRTT